MAESEGVRNFHLNSDVDSSKFAQHHTIGTKYGQAAPGEQFATLRNDFNEQLDRVGNEIAYGQTTASSVPNAPAFPYTNVGGLNATYGVANGLFYAGLGRFECNVEGLYFVDLRVNWNASATNRRILWAIDDPQAGSSDVRVRKSDPPTLSGNFLQLLQFPIYMLPGKAFLLSMYQDTGASLSLPISTDVNVRNGTPHSKLIIITTLK